MDFYAEVVWVRLLTKADDNGNYYRDVRRVHANCMLEKPKATEVDTERALRGLLKIGLLQEYDADGRPYIHLVGFDEWQELPEDRYCKVEHPVHPTSMGGAYIGEGLRRATWVKQSKRSEQELKEKEKSYSELIPEESRRSSGAIADQEEVEVKGKEEVEVQVSDDETFEPVEPNFYTFQRAFKQAAGIKPKDFVGSVERYKVLARKYGEQEVLDSINDWVERRGGKRVTRKDVWSPKNFLEEAEDILDARLEAKSEPGEGAVMPGPRGVREELMR